MQTRGLDICKRLANAPAAIMRGADKDELYDDIDRDAYALGHYEYSHYKLTEPPPLFKGEPRLLGPWEEGCELAMESEYSVKREAYDRGWSDHYNNAQEPSRKYTDDVCMNSWNEGWNDAKAAFDKGVADYGKGIKEPPTEYGDIPPPEEAGEPCPVNSWYQGWYRAAAELAYQETPADDDFEVEETFSPS